MGVIMDAYFFCAGLSLPFYLGWRVWRWLDQRAGTVMQRPHSDHVIDSTDIEQALDLIERNRGPVVFQNDAEGKPQPIYTTTRYGPLKEHIR